MHMWAMLAILPAPAVLEQLTTGSVAAERDHGAADPRPASSDSLDVGWLYAEHASFVTRVIRRLVGDDAHVDDLVQETFVVAFKRRADFDPGRAAPRTWLYGIAARLCQHHRRSTARRSRLGSELARDSDDRSAKRPDEEAERNRRVTALYAVLQELPFKQRETFVLYELEGLEGTSIAKMLAVPEGTVWTRLHHARKKFERLMRRRLAKGCGR